MRNNIIRDFGYLLFLIFFAFDCALAQPTFGPQSSNRYLEWDFDFVEEFDALQNWRPDNGAEGNVGEASGDEYRMPLRQNGEPGPWRYYSAWSAETRTQDWIGDYGDARVWRGTKAAAIDLGGAKGPSRLGLYFFPGYDEYYLFFMVNIPKSEWPTSCVGGSCQAGATGIYEAGNPYTWYASWKFVTHNIGCEAEACWVAGSGYSPVWHQITHLKQYNYGAAPGITFHMEDPAHSDDKWALDGDAHLGDFGANALDYLGGWFGVEYHIKQTATQTIHSIWIYDQQGHSTQVAADYAWDTPAAALGKKWDFFFFGGNNSNTYSWGPTMESAYYIDDVIFDDKRIGPKYFSLITTGPSPYIPSAPKNLKIIEKE